MAGGDDNDRTPQEWRELLSASYDYPEETKQGRRGERRRARRAFRAAERRRTKQWVDEQRRREPMTAAGALVVVALMLGMGLLARCGPDWMGNDGKGTAAPAVSAVPSIEDSKPADTPPPSASPSPSASADFTDPQKVAEEWVRHYLARNPPKDGDHKPAVERAAPWATPALTENLMRHTDPAFDKLVSRGGISTVTKTTVAPAGEKLPPDTPLRIWRTVTATVAVEGYTNYTETTVIHTEVTVLGAGQWRVTRILGV
ncbi:hypothetical protein [Streptomyces subrutilus]|uniref:hypothetical protein n=1 Tax=Streptomyces subrutilus TaxID=36818 RepID=UPI0033DD7383